MPKKFTLVSFIIVYNISQQICRKAKNLQKFTEDINSNVSVDITTCHLLETSV